MDERADRRGHRANSQACSQKTRADAWQNVHEFVLQLAGEVQVKAICDRTVGRMTAALHAQDRFTRELDDAARVASVMVDGDACRRIVTPRAMEFMLRTDAADRYPGERQLRRELQRIRRGQEDADPHFAAGLIPRGRESCGCPFPAIPTRFAW